MNSGAEWKVKIPTAAIISNQYYSGTSEAKNNISTVYVCVCMCAVRWEGGGGGGRRRHSFTRVQGDHCHRAAGPSNKRAGVSGWKRAGLMCPSLNVCSCVLSIDMQIEGCHPSSQMYFVLFQEQVFALTSSSTHERTLAGPLDFD